MICDNCGQSYIKKEEPSYNILDHNKRLAEINLQNLTGRVKNIIYCLKIEKKEFLSKYPFHKTCLLNSRDSHINEIGSLFWYYLQQTNVRRDSMLNISEWELLYNSSFVNLLYD